jgi:transposase-like protein
MPHADPNERKAFMRGYMKTYMKDYRAEHSHPSGRRKGFSETDLAEIVRLYKVECLSQTTIGDRFNCSPGTILYWLRKLKVKSRPQGSPRGFKVTPRHRAQAAKKGVISQATLAAAEFRQPSLISFPESPQLQADFDAIMGDIRSERLMAGR